jgi:hypothetical protein
MDDAGFADVRAPCLGGQGPGADDVASLEPAAAERLREHGRCACLDGGPDGPRSCAASAVRGIAPA